MTKGGSSGERSRVLVITGTSGAGKSTIADAFAGGPGGFSLTTAVTTRTPRPDDRPSQYRYLTGDGFLEMESSGSLAVVASYRSTAYGITWDDLAGASAADRAAILVVTPESCCALVADALMRQRFAVLSVFIDAADDLLDERLLLRDGHYPSDRAEIRRRDRSHSHCCDLVVRNVNLADSVAAIEARWQS